MWPALKAVLAPSGSALVVDGHSGRSPRRLGVEVLWLRARHPLASWSGIVPPRAASVPLALGLRNVRVTTDVIGHSLHKPRAGSPHRRPWIRGYEPSLKRTDQA
ncbi:hypothetical protein SMICM17S_05440 [Streptomyces microflavus]